MRKHQVLAMAIGLALFNFIGCTPRSDEYELAVARVEGSIEHGKCNSAIFAMLESGVCRDWEQQDLLQRFADDIEECVENSTQDKAANYASLARLLKHFKGDREKMLSYAAKAINSYMSSAYCDSYIIADDVIHEFGLTDSEPLAHAAVTDLWENDHLVCWGYCAEMIKKGRVDASHPCVGHRPTLQQASDRFEEALGYGDFDRARDAITVGGLSETFAQRLTEAICADRIKGKELPSELWSFYTVQPECLPDVQTKATLRETLITQQPCEALLLNEERPSGHPEYLPLNEQERARVAEACYAEILADPSQNVAYFARTHPLDAAAQQRAIRAAIAIKDHTGDYTVGKPMPDGTIRIYDLR